MGKLWYRPWIFRLKNIFLLFIYNESLSFFCSVFEKNRLHFLNKSQVNKSRCKNLSMQLGNVNWSDYSWWVMMSYFGAKSSFRLIFFGRSGCFPSVREKSSNNQFYDSALSLQFLNIFLLRYNVFILKTTIFIHLEKKTDSLNT